MIFAYSLKLFRVEALYDGLGQLKFINDKEDLTGLGKYLSDYFLLVRTQKSSVNFQVVYNDGVIEIKNPDSFVKLFANMVVYFRRPYAEKLGVCSLDKKSKEQQPKLKRKKLLEAEKEIVQQNINNAKDPKEEFVAVAFKNLIQTILPQIMKNYDIPQFLPGGIYINNKHTEFENMVSLWQPTKYILIDPANGNTHSPSFCENFLLFKNNEMAIQQLLKDPLAKISKLNKSLMIIEFLMQMIYCLAQENKDLMLYLLLWVAFLVYSGQKTQVAIVLQGSTGIGKSTFIKLLERILPKTSNMRNAQIKNWKFTSSDTLKSQLLTIEELEVSKIDQNLLSELKNGITNDRFTTEAKSKGALENYNCWSFIFASNPPPYGLAEEDDRRFVFFKCSDRMKEEDKNYDPRKRRLSIVRDVIHGTLKWPIKIIKNAGMHVDFRTPCSRFCAQSVDVAKDYDMDEGLYYFFSFYLLRLLIAHPNYRPYHSPPMTKFQVELTLHKDPITTHFWRMVNAEVNHNHDKETFKCPVPACKLFGNNADHFEGNWMVKHVQLNLLEVLGIQKSKISEVHSSLTSTYGLTFKMFSINGQFVDLFDFPSYEKFKERVLAKCSVGYRTLY